ncbi:MAG: NMD3-related protein [archaeon]|nr:60S ribosomal export protein NMD3 [Candidatus Micrarchaeota archaeon]
MSNKFCPECGKTKGSFIQRFCSECYLKKHKVIFLPERIEFESCNRCSKMRFKGNWVEKNELFLIELIQSKIKSKEFSLKNIEVKLNPTEGREINAVVFIEGELNGVSLKIKKEIVLIPLKGLCDTCMKLSSSYYEAILQARFKEKKKHSEKELLKEINFFLGAEEKKDSLSRAIKVIKERNGFDVWIGSKRAAKKVSEELARKFNSSVVRSFTVYGVKKTGEEKKRYTFCVRI